MSETVVSAELIGKTQKSLGKYVKKPALTEKLLRKPPFRFLHDVIKAMIRETHFLEGLFSESELNSDNVKEKEAKVAFLTKLIDAVKTLSNTDLKVRPSKIVAGLEATETNLLLQTIARCIDKKVDSKSYVAKFKSGLNSERKTSKQSEKDRSKKRESSVSRIKKAGSVETPKSTASDRAKAKEKRDSSISRTKKVRGSSNETPKSTDRNRTVKVKESSKHKGDGDKVVANDANEETKAALEENLPSKPIIEETTLQQPEAPAATESFSNARESSANLVRPKSARPKSGEQRILSTKAVDNADAVLPSAAAAAATPSPPARPPSQLRPPSVRPSSARPGAPRLRPESALAISEPVVMGNINVIVENFDSGLGEEDEDTVVIENAPEEVGEEQQEDVAAGGNKGQLVEQILEQLQEEDGKRKVEIDWEQDGGLRGKDATTKEVTHLRSAIQSLTKTANPLGKLMNYLHEDLDAMHNELQMWTNTKRQLYVEIEKQKKLTVESSKPLLDRLANLRKEIRKQEQEIVTVRSNILRNDQRIAELLGNK